MSLQPPRIRPLPLESQAQIRSSVVITSLNDVIIGLLENAFDAGASSVEICLDHVKGYCSVTDNGVGIPAAEFGPDGHLGSLHCTSKPDVPRPMYGSYGRFLYNLAALSLLSITSIHGSSAAAITLHRANIIARSSGNSDFAEAIRGDHGTHVVVANLFGDIPVRYRHIASRLQNVAPAEAEFASLRKRIVALILACGRAIDIKMGDVKTKHTYKHKSDALERRTSFELGAICSVLQQAGYISRFQTPSFKLISVQTSSIRIRAAISLHPAPAKDVQFISIGIRPVYASVSMSLFSDEINTVFELSSFGAMEDDAKLPEDEQNHRLNDRYFASDGHTARQLNTQKKGVDRWPMFYVRIDPQYARASTVLDDEQKDADLTEKWVEKTLDLLRSMFHEFLSVHHFRPRGRKGRRLERINLNHVATGESAQSQAGSMLPVRAASDPLLVPRHFDAWSRVKTGSTAAKLTGVSNNLDKQKHLCICKCADSRPQTPAERVRLAQCALDKIELQALCNKAPEFLIEEYHAEGQSVNGAQSPDGKEDHDSHPDTDAAQFLDADEAAYLWTNPATGIEHKINARNGLILPQSNSSRTRRSIAANAIASQQPASEVAETTITQPVRAKPAKMSPTELIASLEQSDLVRSFRPVEERIPSIVPDELNNTVIAQQNREPGRFDCKSSEHFAALVNVKSHRLSRQDLEQAEVLAQVDRKFILIQTQLDNESDPLLVLIDQHAADERVKVEDLYTQLCSGDTTILVKPMTFEVPPKEIELFIRHQKHFADWQIIYNVKDKASEQDSMKQVIVSVLPSLISERCRLDPKLLIDLLRREIHHASPSSSFDTLSSNWIHRISYCPTGLVDMVNSRACRSAIMFNDVLDKEQCKVLLSGLMKCTLPFQCAHGRPSCVVLPGWSRKKGIQKDEMGFADKFTKWKDL